MHCGSEHPPLIGDFSLNAANSLTAAMYLALGLSRITPTHDLNGAQVAELARRIGADKHRGGGVPASAGFSYRALRVLPLPLEGNQLSRLRAPLRKASRRAEGLARPRPSGDGRRGMPQHRFWRRGAGGEPSSRRVARAGIRHFRLEFVHESAAQVKEIARLFAAALAGETTAQQLSGELKQFAPQGTTEGSLFIPADYLKLPILQ